MNIALFGLTGDPVHVGHLRVVSTITRNSLFSRVLIHVAYQPSYKEPIATFEQRLDMTNLTFGSMNPRVTVIKDKIKYTSQVVRMIRKYLSDDEIYFFTGEDWDIGKFHDAKYLKKNVTQVLVSDTLSYKYSHMHKDKHGIMRFGISNPIKLHSSDIRSMKDPIDGLVPDSVLNYIKKERLYGYKK
jgi:nicotinate (nicotinamide) nucleotide adenylyltransferase